ncbi:MAG TPA: SAM-dependent methyltransferase, partial [Bacteroidales bacterium]|nr:SAM-dependent methyltransferase [Bacteroidales bacterium]
KAGMMNAEAHQWKLQKLHPHSQLFTSNFLQPEFMGRIFEVHSVFGLNKQELHQHLAGISHANITIRNFPIDEKTLRKKLKLKDGGDITLFATTLYNQKHVLILTQLPQSQ